MFRQGVARVAQLLRVKSVAKRAPAALALGTTIGAFAAPTVWCKEEVNWSEVRKEIVKILENDSYKELPLKLNRHVQEELRCYKDLECHNI